VLEDHRLLRADEGFSAVPPSELALISASRLLPEPTRKLVAYLQQSLSPQ